MPTNHSFEEQFRERFGNLEEAPPAFAWNKIRQEIAPAQTVKIKASPKQFTWLVPGSFIAVISIALLFLLKYNKAMESQQVSKAKQAALMAEADEKAIAAPETVNQPETTPEVAEVEKPAFKAYNQKPAPNTVATTTFVKKRYLKMPEKSEKAQMPAVATKKRPDATKVVYVVTVDPKSTSVEKIATSVPDSAAVSGIAN